MAPSNKILTTRMLLYDLKIRNRFFWNIPTTYTKLSSVQNCVMHFHIHFLIIFYKLSYIHIQIYYVQYGGLQRYTMRRFHLLLHGNQMENIAIYLRKNVDYFSIVKYCHNLQTFVDEIQTRVYMRIGSQVSNFSPRISRLPQAILHR